MEPKNQLAEFREILEHFNYAPSVPADVLKEYCNVKGFNEISVDVYAEVYRKYQSDERAKVLLPKILALIAERFVVVSFLAPKSTVEKSEQDNSALMGEVAYLIETSGVCYGDDLNDLLKTLQSSVKIFIEGAGNRITNIIERVKRDDFIEKYGEDVTVARLAEEFKKRAN